MKLNEFLCMVLCIINVCEWDEMVIRHNIFRKWDIRVEIVRMCIDCGFDQ